MESIAVKSPEQLARVVKWAPRLVAFGEFIDGYDLLCMGAALLFLKPQFHLDGATTGWLAAIAFIGTAVGLVVFGDLADRFGRKVIFLLNLAFFVVAALGSAFVTEVWQLMLARFLIGVAVGMDIPTSQSFLAEVAPDARRGRVAGSLPNMMWLGGAIASVLIALAIKPYTGEATWRWLFGLAAVPALAVLIARQSLPESPRWLLSQGRTEEARHIIASLGLPEPAIHVRSQRSYRALFTGKSLRRLLAVSAFFALQSFAGGLSTVAGPLVFSMIGFHTDQALYFALGGFAMALVAVLCGALVIDRVNRQKMGIYTCLAAFVCVMGMVMAGQSNVYLLFACYIAYSMMVWFGPAVLSWVWSAEVFPTEMRGIGTGITQCVTRLVIALNLVIAPTLIMRFGLKAIAIYAVVYIVCAIIVACSPFLDSTNVELEKV
jgi:MFS transporter, putative metabolite transport protein